MVREELMATPSMATAVDSHSSACSYPPVKGRGCRLQSHEELFVTDLVHRWLLIVLCGTCPTSLDTL